MRANGAPDDRDRVTGAPAAGARRGPRRVLGVLAAVALVAAGCAGEEDAADDGAARTLLGAGATFPTPVFLEWLGEYREQDPSLDINYQSIGSGGGIEQFISENVDFGASERYLTDEDLQAAREARGCEAIHVPIVFGGVAVSYNVPGIDEGLVLDATTIASIFEVEITRWDDPEIAALNPDVELPDRAIIPVHRTDGSGTTYIFTRFLSEEVDRWAAELGYNTTINWPAGTIGGPGNEGVATALQHNPGAIGYLSLSFVTETDLVAARVVNADGHAVLPTVESVSTAAAEVADDLPGDLRFDILGVGGEGFPIVGTNWVLVWECGYGERTAELLRRFWTWALTEGDELAGALSYSPLTGQVEELALEAVARINREESGAPPGPGAPPADEGAPGETSPE